MRSPPTTTVRPIRCPPPHPGRAGPIPSERQAQSPRNRGANNFGIRGPDDSEYSSSRHATAPTPPNQTPPGPYPAPPTRSATTGNHRSTEPQSPAYLPAYAATAHPNPQTANRRPYHATVIVVLTGPSFGFDGGFLLVLPGWRSTASRHIVWGGRVWGGRVWPGSRSTVSRHIAGGGRVWGTCCWAWWASESSLKNGCTIVGDGWFHCVPVSSSCGFSRLERHFLAI